MLVVISFITRLLYRFRGQSEPEAKGGVLSTLRIHRSSAVPFESVCKVGRGNNCTAPTAWEMTALFKQQQTPLVDGHAEAAAEPRIMAHSSRDLFVKRVEDVSRLANGKPGFPTSRSLHLPELVGEGLFSQSEETTDPQGAGQGRYVCGNRNGDVKIPDQVNGWQNEQNPQPTFQPLDEGSTCDSTTISLSISPKDLMLPAKTDCRQPVALTTADRQVGNRMVGNPDSTEGRTAKDTVCLSGYHHIDRVGQICTTGGHKSGHDRGLNDQPTQKQTLGLIGETDLSTQSSATVQAAEESMSQTLSAWQPSISSSASKLHTAWMPTHGTTTMMMTTTTAATTTSTTTTPTVSNGGEVRQITAGINKENG
ncbi:unnamed protein product [Protopolystoma xenopodis]|uniref:Uncharacterized protein n=1 Tax=Protopolystoma xenopodis TaxID=117903 RepID=A0A448X280_9PLAT|nr:unnamed protein product [Protopolystoma xenopodis]